MVIMTILNQPATGERTMVEKPSQVGVADAKKWLSELLGRVAYGGETITIVKRGRPMARLVPVAGPGAGHLAHVKGWLADDDPFLAAMEEIVSARHARPARRPPLRR
jgi:prevent-host-death family protein